MTDTAILPDHLQRLAETMALGEVLTDWDESLSYSDVRDILDKHFDEFVTDERLTVWQVFELSSGSDIDDQLESMRRAFLRAMTAGYTAVGANALDGTETDVLGDLLFYTVRNADEDEDKALYRGIASKLFNTDWSEEV
jgi:hypothetical protein